MTSQYVAKCLLSLLLLKTHIHIIKIIMEIVLTRKMYIERKKIFSHKIYH